MAYGGDLQANTAVDLMVGPFVDEDDGKTAETGLTITQAEVRLSKNGGNIAQKNEATSLTHDELGNYVCKLDTTDTNTEGLLTLMVHESGALPIKMDYTVLAQAAYISKYTAKDTGFMDTNVKTITAGIIANASFNADVGSTAHGTNIIALACRKILEELNLDHLLKVVTAAADMTTEVTDNTILSRVLANGDTSNFVPSTDGLQPIRDDRTLPAADYTVVGDTIAAVTNVGTVTGNVNGSVGSVTGAVGSVTGAVGSVAGNVDGTVATVNALANNVITAASINADAITNAKIADDAIAAENFATNAIATDAVAATALDKVVMSDLATGAPSATASLPVALNWIYESFRNKTTTTATLITIMKDDGSTALAKSTISDDATTFTKGEFVSGA